LKRWRGLLGSLFLVAITFTAVSCADEGLVDSTATSASVPATDTSAGSVTTVGSSTTTSSTGTTAAPSDRLVVHPAGAAFLLPADWDEVAGSAIATEFSAATDCVSAQVVDQELVEGGPGPSIYRAIVQVCAQPVVGDLEDFMERTYGEDRARFEPAELAGRAAYRLAEGGQSIYFVGGEREIYQIVTLVETDPELEEVRKEQIGQLLTSLTFER